LGRPAHYRLGPSEKRQPNGDEEDCAQRAEEHQSPRGVIAQLQEDAGEGRDYDHCPADHDRIPGQRHDSSPEINVARLERWIGS
jgi:hypothetical protein